MNGWLSRSPDISIYIAGLKLDNVEDMGQWLDVDLLDAEGEKGHPPDLFVVGFQEVGGSSETSFIYIYVHS